MKKFMLRVIPVVLVLLLVVAPVFATNVLDPNFGQNAGNVGNVGTAVQRVWNTVLTVLQVVALAAVVFAGVRYMMTGAEGKAEIKNGMIGLVVGAILVFGASTIVKFIITAGNSVTNGLTQ